MIGIPKKTKRKAPCEELSSKEREDYSVIIRNAPWLYEPLLTILEKFVKKAKTLHDVACGDGYLLELINERHTHLRISGSDKDPKFIKEAREKYHYSFECMDIENTSKKYDIITCNLALHHFKNPIKIISNLQKKAKIVIISDQLRPNTQKNLEKRMNKREKMLKGKETPFYQKNERESILEAYSKKEIIEIFSLFPARLTFFDTDYYERFVAVIKK